MKNILVAYATNAGSTAEVAQVVGDELGKDGSQVAVRPINEIASLEGYDAVVVGAPMIMGWHRSAISFVRKHRQALSNLEVAYFLTAMSLTQADDHTLDGKPIYLDPGLAKPPKNVKRLSFKERYTTVANYLQPVLKAAPGIKPVSVGFFGGRLDLFRLNWWQKLFVMLVIQAQPGEFRNWDFIREWAARLRDGVTR